MKTQQQKIQARGVTTVPGQRIPKRALGWLLVAGSVLTGALFVLRSPASLSTGAPAESRPVARPSATSAASGNAVRLAGSVPVSVDKQQLLQRVTAVLFKGLQDDGSLGVDLGGFTDAELVANFKDDSVPLLVRRRLALELARRSSAAAYRSLEELATTGVAELRAVAAEALGHSSHAEAKNTLLALAGEQDEVVLQGVIRGLSAVGDADAIQALAALLTGATDTPTVQAAAALGLGDIKSPAAATTLITALNQLDDSTIKEQVLTALGRQPFSVTEPFFRAYLDSPDVKVALRVAALDSVAGADGDTTPLLMLYIHDNDPQVRAAAAWGLTMAETAAGAGSELATLLANECDATVRARLYQALGVQDDFDFTGVLPAIEREQNANARLAGFGLWAGQCGAGIQAPIAARFDQIAVPELQHLALESADLNERLTAVIALRWAGTPAAQTTLRQLARQAPDAAVADAAHAALAARSLVTSQTVQATTNQ